MNILKFFFFTIALMGVSALSAQKVVLPSLKDNLSAKSLITGEISNLRTILKSNPSQNLTDKLDLFELALSYLDEPSIIKTTTEYALTSAFLNYEVNKTGVQDQVAFNRFYAKIWSQDFIDLVNLVKI